MTSIPATAYETVIGLEVHVQLRTARKMFCGCSAAYADATPNTHVCPVCMALPGVLPVMNRRAVELTVMAALALNCTIPTFSKFDRKNYPYPDLLKGYQISQFDLPLSMDGWLDVEVEGQPVRRVGITRCHLEEDTARLTHRTEFGESFSLIDMNRAGVPLMECVSEPDMRSPEEARAYLVKLQRIMRYIGVSLANMEEGNFRCDANVSLRPAGASEYGAKVEVKNMNSFRAVYNALIFEVGRQTAALDAGERIAQETRGWLDTDGVTVSQRSKEGAHDYRYFPEPDLPPVTLSEQEVAAIRAQLPELPDAKMRRFEAQYGLTPYEANLLTETRARADYFEAAVAPAHADGDAAAQARARQAAHWILGDYARLLNADGREFTGEEIPPRDLHTMLRLIEGGTITGTAAKSVFEEVFRTGKPPADVVRELGLEQISGADEISAVVDRVLAAHPKPVEDYRAGKQEAIKFLVGQAMRETRGRANAATLTDMLKARLTNAG
ncbi:MAG: Asp-tRNA(Asn)/Glu-tRNA(Gln) amidotransferase subunit GatB [Chloroflexi bacterium]|nr:Asp-tRNA(Asn)/Glu-tRNA(Gln) amidotransferase subunit GatB [Chloroflexota bacterium]